MVMSLVEYNLFGEKRDKVQRAIDIVRSFEPPEGYYLADSGGKDSTATKAILRMAGVKFESHYNVTTVDPPELVRFVIRQNEAVIYDMPDGTHKYFTVQDRGKLLMPVSPETVVGKRTIHFSIPK
jgi:phosphoadenosine phosphosulfate reductase